ncbi:MAG: phosphatidylglycerophosphatase A [Rickettsiales bacterium]
MLNNPYDLKFLNAARANMRVKPPFAWYTIVVTWFYVGMISIAPGTLGSIATYPLYFWITETADGSEDISAMHNVLKKFWAVSVFCFAIGWVAIIKFQQKTRTFDHKMVVIDEVIGMFITLAISFDWAYAIASKLASNFDMSERNFAFLVVLVVFRYYDIMKPFFIGAIDKYYKKPLGVILDDVAAAAFSALTIFILLKITDYFL